MQPFNYLKTTKDAKTLVDNQRQISETHHYILN